MNGENIGDEDLMTIFEAARWAPSSFNSQPWRFIYAKKDDSEWNDLFDLLFEKNKLWAKNASALIVILSRKNFEHNNQLSRTHSFDTGAAWQNLALQASMNGFIAHAIGGFDYEKAQNQLNIPEEFSVEAMVAIGKPGNKEDLPLELQEREKQSDRNALSEIIIKGKYGGQ
jgi:nitroreductase